MLPPGTAGRPLAALRLTAAVLMQMAEFTKPDFFAIEAPQRRLTDIHQDAAGRADEALEPYSQKDGDESFLKESTDMWPLLETADAEAVAAIIARCLALLFVVRDSVPDTLQPLITSFDPDVAKVWEPGEEFFRRMPRESLVSALGEAAVTGVAPSKKKKELVEMALRALPPVGWLPKPLRTPSYKGPGSNTWAEARATTLADEIAQQENDT